MGLDYNFKKQKQKNSGLPGIQLRKSKGKIQTETDVIQLSNKEVVFRIHLKNSCKPVRKRLTKQWKNGQNN